MHFNDLGVRWILKIMQGNYQCDSVTRITKKMRVGEGERGYFLRPLQLVINICIFAL